ncbi:prostatic acid phosphatase isoform X3 [Bemisia tabaci]|uniref:prostatic acid phosphatase isoform X3 n=1 Tax=Bemisia tabaci TaxID=7038 RepID=UPI003B286A15
MQYKPKIWSWFLVIIIVISVVTAGVRFCIFRGGSSAEPTLRFVSIIHRHGDRAPEASYPLDPYRADSFWPEGLGALLQSGKIGLHRLGTFLRQRYDGFLAAKYLPAEIFVFSSFHDRCLMSASLVLAGLYPPLGTQLWNPDLKWQPIPIHTVPLTHDDIICVSKRCPLLSKEEAKWLATIQLKLEEQGLPLPEWAHTINRDRLRSLSDIGVLKHFATPTMIKLKSVRTLFVPRKESGRGSVNIGSSSQNYSCVLIKEILMNMELKANARERFERRLHLYSAHDGTIAYLWRGLSVTSEIERSSLSYGAALIIELHEINGKHQVKILYKRSHLDDNLMVLKIEGCKDSRGKETGDLCDLDIFSSALQHVAIDNFEKACEIPIEQT